MWQAFTPFRRFSTQATKIPGLKFIPNFVNNETQKTLLLESLSLQRAITENAKGKQSKKTQTYLSKQHNLKSDEHYKLLHLSYPKDLTLDCQHFEQYGEDGHQLTYFIGNQNIPSFIRSKLINEMEQLDEVKAVKEEKFQKASRDHKQMGELNWNFTFNIYGQQNENPNLVAGFPFHIDVASNGQVTAIFTLMSNATLEMRKKGETEASHSIQLTPGSLFLLSGESRWEWEHRVLPKNLQENNDSEDEHCPHDISRISLVLGCL